MSAFPPAWMLRRFDDHRDERGNLVAIETADAGFAIERVYYIYGAARDVARGFHAHRALHQLAICVAGACTLSLDDGRRQETVRLDNPAMGLRIGPMVWREMCDFTSDCVLMVLASAAFDAADYIHDHEDFVRLATAR